MLSEEGAPRFGARVGGSARNARRPPLAPRACLEPAGSKRFIGDDLFDSESRDLTFKHGFPLKIRRRTPYLGKDRKIGIGTTCSVKSALDEPPGLMPSTWESSRKPYPRTVPIESASKKRLEGEVSEEPCPKSASDTQADLLFNKF